MSSETTALALCPTEHTKQADRLELIRISESAFFDNEVGITRHIELAGLLARLVFTHGRLVKPEHWYEACTRETGWLEVTQDYQREALCIEDERARFKVTARHIPEYRPDQRDYWYRRSGKGMRLPLASFRDHIASIEELEITSGIATNHGLPTTTGKAIAAITHNGYISEEVWRYCSDDRIHKPNDTFHQFMGLVLPDYDATQSKLRSRYLNADSEEFRQIEALSHTLMQEAIIESAA